MKERKWKQETIMHLIILFIGGGPHLVGQQLAFLSPQEYSMPSTKLFPEH